MSKTCDLPIHLPFLRSPKLFVFQNNQSLASTEKRNPAISCFQQAFRQSERHRWCIVLTVSIRRFTQHEWQRTWITEKPVWSGSDPHSTRSATLPTHTSTSLTSLLTIFLFSMKIMRTFDQPEVCGVILPTSQRSSNGLIPVQLPRKPLRFPHKFQREKNLWVAQQWAPDPDPW